jgi:hypothetical protein
MAKHVPLATRSSKRTAGSSVFCGVHPWLYIKNRNQWLVLRETNQSKFEEVQDNSQPMRTGAAEHGFYFIVGAVITRQPVKTAD